ncbi:AI-2E family transporter [Arenibacterium sp. CAU 1754]
MRDAPLLNLVLITVLIVIAGTLLVVGKAVLLPIFVAAISIYVLTSTTEGLRRIPVFRNLPVPVLRVSVLAVFTAIVLAIAVLFSATVREIAAVAPQYEANLDRFVLHLAERYGFETHELWDEIFALTFGQIDLQKLVLGALGGFTSLGAAVFLTVVYAAFMLSERGKFERKIAAAADNDAQAQEVFHLFGRINRQIRGYITTKTLINILLAVMSYVILWAFGVDFALFWAFLIGLLNYIPYVGSYVAVAFPVLISVGQFGEFTRPAILVVLLTVVQTIIANYVEPRVVGRQLNLSPFVVLVSLSFWATLWGIPGAILAVPLTSVLAIILASFDTTRPVAILMSDQVGPGADSDIDTD